MGTVRLALRLVARAGRGQLAVVIASGFITSAAIAGELLIGRAVLDLLAGEQRVSAGRLAPYLVVMGILLIVASLSQSVAGELRTLLSERVHRLTMDEILDVATEVDYESYELSEFHDRLQRARIAAGGQSAAVVFGIVTVVSTLVVSAGVLAVLVATVPALVPIAVIGYLPIAVVNARNTRARYQFERDLTELQRDRAYLEILMTERVFAPELRAYGTAPTLRVWHGELWDVRLARLRALARRRLAGSSAASLVTTSALVATLSIALILTGRGSISIGDAAAAILGLQQLSGRLQSAGGALNGVHEGVTFLRDFESFRSVLPDLRARRPVTRPPSPPTVLRADHLRYRYPGATEDAVRDISFELRRGQIMAVVGANGSGKTTLSKMLCNLLAPASGSVSWDGVDLAGCDPALVNDQIAPVFQDFVPYMLTIRRAVALGDTSRLDDDTSIWSAVRQVGLDGVVGNLPNGLDTRLGKAFAGGVDLSGGQWQRLAIARALFRDAPVVVLDEPSASLDPRAESELFDLLQTLCSDRIVIFVSHRFATVRSADVVMVLDQGEVVEIGSHAELMASGGLYAELFQLQAARYAT